MNRKTFIRSSIATALAYPYAKHFGSTERATSHTELINVGIIGIGERGRHLMEVIRRDVPAVKVLAYCDIVDKHLETGAQLADEGAKGYRDYRALLADTRIDAVFIATPLHLHYPMVMAAMEAEKHIYCEKTLAYSIEQSIAIRDAAKTFSQVFQVGYQERSSPLFQQIFKLIQNGACGEISHTACYWNRNGNWRRYNTDTDQDPLINWRMYRAFSGGLMAELCSHQIDLVNWITQSHPLKVRGSGGIDYWKDGRETFDNVSAIFNYPSGLKATFTALTTNAFEGFRMHIYGTRATIEVNREAGQAAFIYPETTQLVDGVTGATDVTSTDADKIPILVDETPYSDDSTARAILDFCKAINDGTPPPSTVESAYRSSIAVHMANKAMENDTVETWQEEKYG